MLYISLPCYPDSAIFPHPLLEFISCPGYKQVYLTRDVTEHCFLHCFSAGQSKMARVSQDKQRSGLFFPEICSVLVHKSLCSSLHSTYYPFVHLPDHPFFHSSMHPSIFLSRRESVFELGNSKWRCFSLSHSSYRKISVLSFYFFFPPLN